MLASCCMYCTIPYGTACTVSYCTEEMWMWMWMCAKLQYSVLSLKDLSLCSSVISRQSSRGSCAG